MWHVSKFILSQWHLLNFRSVFRHLIQVDPDTLWFTLNELHCPSSYVPPHPDLQPVKMSGMGRQRDEYSDNVLKLLKEEFDSVTETAGESVTQWAAEWRERLSRLSMDGFLAPLDPNPASQLRGSDSRAGKQPADVTAITFGLFTALISIKVQTALSVQQLFCCKWRDKETLQTSVFITHWQHFFSASALFSIICCTILLYFILFMVIINITSKVVLMNQPDGWWVVGWSCDPVLLPFCCNFCLWDKKKWWFVSSKFSRNQILWHLVMKMRCFGVHQ